jgi:type II secretory pathway component HofQ
MPTVHLRPSVLAAPAAGVLLVFAAVPALAGGAIPAAPSSPDAALLGPQDTHDLEAAVQARLEQALYDRAIDKRLARRAIRDLEDVRAIEEVYHRMNGELTESQRQDIFERLRRVEAELKWVPSP